MQSPANFIIIPPKTIRDDVDSKDVLALHQTRQGINSTLATVQNGLFLWPFGKYSQRPCQGMGIVSLSVAGVRIKSIERVRLRSKAARRTHSPSRESVNGIQSRRHPAYRSFETPQAVGEQTRPESRRRAGSRQGKPEGQGQGTGQERSRESRRRRSG